MPQRPPRRGVCAPCSNAEIQRVASILRSTANVLVLRPIYSWLAAFATVSREARTDRHELHVASQRALRCLSASATNGSSSSSQFHHRHLMSSECWTCEGASLSGVVIHQLGCCRQVSWRSGQWAGSLSELRCQSAAGEVLGVAFWRSGTGTRQPWVRHVSIDRICSCWFLAWWYPVRFPPVQPSMVLLSLVQRRHEISESTEVA